MFSESLSIFALSLLNSTTYDFEYEAEWMESGFSISPFSLPLRKEVFFPKSYEPFEGLFGVFADSLPDPKFYKEYRAKNGL